MIRKFQPRDMDRVINLMIDNRNTVGNSVAEYDVDRLVLMVRKAIIGNDFRVFVVEHSGQMIGYAFCLAFEHPWFQVMEGEIMMWHMEEQYLDTHHFKQLMAECDSWFTNMNCEFYCVSTRAFTDGYQPNQRFIENSDHVLQKTMTKTGHTYVRAVH